MTDEELMQIESYLLDRKKPDYELSGKIMNAFDLINRLEEENANYSRNNRSLTEAVTEMQKALKKQNAEIEKLTYKFECLLCHATGSKLSKSTYSLRTMEIAVNDEVQQCCEEAKSEAIKEFAERLKQEVEMISYEMCSNYQDTIDAIDNLLKEIIGE